MSTYMHAFKGQTLFQFHPNNKVFDLSKIIQKAQTIYCPTNAHNNNILRLLK